MSINKLLDVEEHVWSPMYGLKGNIDATVQVIMQDEEGERTLVVPFEVKTGKNTSSASHRAQTALYTLLLSDRYGKLFATNNNDPPLLTHIRYLSCVWRIVLYGNIRNIAHTGCPSRASPYDHATKRVSLLCSRKADTPTNAEDHSYMQSMLRQNIMLHVSQAGRRRRWRDQWHEREVH